MWKSHKNPKVPCRIQLKPKILSQEKWNEVLAINHLTSLKSIGSLPVVRTTFKGHSMSVWEILEHSPSDGARASFWNKHIFELFLSVGYYENLFPIDIGCPFKHSLKWARYLYCWVSRMILFDVSRNWAILCKSLALFRFIKRLWE